MNPIQNDPQFAFDYERFVLQNQVPPAQPPIQKKPFEVKKSEKSNKAKKDLKKDKKSGNQLKKPFS